MARSIAGSVVFLKDHRLRAGLVHPRRQMNVEHAYRPSGFLIVRHNMPYVQHRKRKKAQGMRLSPHQYPDCTDRSRTQIWKYVILSDDKYFNMDKLVLALLWCQTSDSFFFR